MQRFQPTIFKHGNATLFRLLSVDQQPGNRCLELFIFNIRDFIILLVLNIEIFRGWLSPAARPGRTSGLLTGR